MGVEVHVGVNASVGMSVGLRMGVSVEGHLGVGVSWRECGCEFWWLWVRV